jgi:hypothetical protein
MTGTGNWKQSVINGTPTPEPTATGADLAGILDSFDEGMRKLAAAYGIASPKGDAASSAKP